MSERLYQQLERHYQREGWEVRGLFSASGEVPPAWQALPPDLLLEKQGRTTAVYRLKTIEDIRARLQAYRRLLAEPDTTIRFLVESRRDQIEARSLLADLGLSCEVALVHRAGRRAWRRFAYPRRRWWKAAIFILLLVLATLLVWLVTVFYGYYPRYYEPRDLERKVKEWKQK